MTPPPGYSFSDEYAIVPDISGLWRTTAPMWFEVGGKGSGAWLVVPTGFRTDGPSIPAIARWLLSPSDSRFWRAAIIHDYLLNVPEFSTTVAAISFRDALLAGHVGKLKAYMMMVPVWLYTTFIRPMRR